MQDRLDGYDYCIDHILQDKNAPFKQCNFVSSKSGMKCTRAASKADKRDGYCKQHTKKAAAMRYKASLKPKPKDPAQQLLDDLSYYLPGSSKSFPDAPVSTVGKLMDYASGSDSDAELPVVNQCYQSGHDSDADSVDSEPEDALKYAEVYTAEEVALITRDKLIRLQSLYINQFKRLQHMLKEKRREFLFNVKKEMPIYGPNLGRVSDSKEKKKLKKLKALVSYRKRKGQCALLHRKSKDRRIQVTPDYQGPVKETKLPKCSYKPSEGETCDKPCVPLIKYCMDHVFEEPHQVLYKQCTGASGICKRAAVPYSKGRSCILHQEVPRYTPRVWKLKKKEAILRSAAAAKASSLTEPVETVEPMEISYTIKQTQDPLLLPSTSSDLSSAVGMMQKGPLEESVIGESSLPASDTQSEVANQAASNENSVSSLLSETVLEPEVKIPVSASTPVSSTVSADVGTCDTTEKNPIPKSTASGKPVSEDCKKSVNLETSEEVGHLREKVAGEKSDVSKDSVSETDKAEGDGVEVTDTVIDVTGISSEPAVTTDDKLVSKQ